MEILDKINQQLNEFKEKRQALIKELQAEFPSLLTPLFAKSKRLESVGWQQYTPYFNDGDECIFGVHNDDLIINGVEDSYDDTEGKTTFIREKVWNGKDWVKNDNLDKEEFEILKQIEKVLRGIPDDFYKDFFGDHVKVVVYKDGRIETEEYEHD